MQNTKRANVKNKVCAISFAIHEHGWEKHGDYDPAENTLSGISFLLDKREQYFIRFYDSFKNGL